MRAFLYTVDNHQRQSSSFAIPQCLNAGATLKPYLTYYPFTQDKYSGSIKTAR